MTATSLAMRPTFMLHLDQLEANEAMDRLRTLLDDPRWVGQTVGHHLTLAPPRARRRLFSSWLTMEVGATAEHGSIVHGRFHPAPSVWTGYMLSYIALMTIGLGAAGFALSQWMIRAAPHAIWIMLAAIIVAGAMWWSAKVGQRLSQDEMRELKDAVERVLAPRRIDATAMSPPAGRAAEAQSRA